MFKPRLEVLEDRLALSGGGNTPLSYGITGTTFWLNGASSGTFANLRVDDNGDLVGRINGRNVFVDNATLVGLTQFNLNFGNKSDSFKMDFAAGLALDGINWTINANMGDGNDTFLIRANELEISNSRITVNVNGGEDNDTIGVHAVFTNLANAVLAANLNGDDDKDNIVCKTDGFYDFDSALTFNGWGGDGNDTVRGNHYIRAGSEGLVRAYAAGNDDSNVIRLEFRKEDLFDVLRDGSGAVADGSGGRRNQIITSNLVQVWDPNGLSRRL